MKKEKITIEIDDLSLRVCDDDNSKVKPKLKVSCYCRTSNQNEWEKRTFYTENYFK